MHGKVCCRFCSGRTTERSMMQILLGYDGITQQMYVKGCKPPAITKLCEGAFLRIIYLGALNDDGVGWQVDTPSKRCRAAEHLDCSL